MYVYIYKHIHYIYIYIYLHTHTHIYICICIYKTHTHAYVIHKLINIICTHARTIGLLINISYRSICVYVHVCVFV